MDFLAADMKDLAENVPDPIETTGCISGNLRIMHPTDESQVRDQYRVSHLVVHLDWVDLKFECSTVCLILPGLVGIWQEQLGSWARQWNSHCLLYTSPSPRD